MKHLIITFALFTSSLSYATNYDFKQSTFSAKAVLKNTGAANTTLPAFDFSGHSLWIEDPDGVEAPRAQITIRRTTYDCDNVYGSGGTQYSCNLQGPKLLQILDEVATQEPQYAAAVAVLKNYYDYNGSYETFNIPLGDDNQVGEDQKSLDFADPNNENLDVQVDIKYSGMNPL